MVFGKTGHRRAYLGIALIGADTQAAILKFERDRKLPPTGHMSDRLVKELSNMTGRPID